jgi:hypothetical protein
MRGILPLKSILIIRHIGDSGQFPLCQIQPEMVMHMMFQCNGAASIWKALGTDNIIWEALHVDRSASAFLQEILKFPTKSVPGYSSINIQDLVAVSCWYIC